MAGKKCIARPSLGGDWVQQKTYSGCLIGPIVLFQIQKRVTFTKEILVWFQERIVCNPSTHGGHNMAQHIILVNQESSRSREISPQRTPLESISNQNSDGQKTVLHQLALGLRDILLVRDKLPAYVYIYIYIRVYVSMKAIMLGPK